MAADSAVEKGTQVASGAFKKVSGFTWNRIKPTMSGLPATIGGAAIFTGVVWLAAPAAMAAATGGAAAGAAGTAGATTVTTAAGTTTATITAGGAASGTTAAASEVTFGNMIATGGNHFIQAVGVSAKGFGHMIAHADWSGVGEATSQFFQALGGEAAVEEGGKKVIEETMTQTIGTGATTTTGGVASEAGVTVSDFSFSGGPTPPVPTPAGS